MRTCVLVEVGLWGAGLRFQPRLGLKHCTSQVLALPLLPVFNALVAAVMGMALQELGAGLGLLSPSHSVGTGWAISTVLIPGVLTLCCGCLFPFHPVLISLQYPWRVFLVHNVLPGHLNKNSTC